MARQGLRRLHHSASINGDTLNTLEYFVLLCGQHAGIWVGVDIKPTNVKASKSDDLNRMGSYIAPMAQSPADASPEEMSPGGLERHVYMGTRLSDRRAVPIRETSVRLKSTRADVVGPKPLQPAAKPLEAEDYAALLFFSPFDL